MSNGHFVLNDVPMTVAPLATGSTAMKRWSIGRGLDLALLEEAVALPPIQCHMNSTGNASPGSDSTAHEDELAVVSMARSHVRPSTSAGHVPA